MTGCGVALGVSSEPSSTPVLAQPLTSHRSSGRREVPEARKSTAAQPTAITLQQRLDRFFGADYPLTRWPGQTRRVGAKQWGAWIQPKPRAGALPLGSIRIGASLPLSRPELLAGHGRCKHFVRVEGGFVCVSSRTSLESDDAFLRAAAWTAPAPYELPYNYALSLGAPMLTRPVPQAQFKWKLGSRKMRRMRGWNAGHDELAVDRPIEANGPMPALFKEGAALPSTWGPARGVYKKRIPRGSMLAYTRAFEAYGRVWVLSTDMSVVPAAGLKRFRVSKFRGVKLGRKVRLPLGWTRRQPVARWRRDSSSAEPIRSEEVWPPRTWVMLTGETIAHQSRRFFITREGSLVEASRISLVGKPKKIPWEAKKTGRWIHIRVNRGTLTLYEGPKAVFTTLMSPGKDDATPYGRYFLESKHHVSTMTTESGEPRRFWIADVPWTMYFKRPYAIHGSYWHEDFGHRKSGGCVNLSPHDAKYVFEWTRPELPRSWGSVQGYGMGGGTFVLIEG